MAGYRARAAISVRRHAVMFRVARLLFIVLAPCVFAFLYFTKQTPTDSVSLLTAVAIYLGVIGMIFLLQGLLGLLSSAFED